MTIPRLTFVLLALLLVAGPLQAQDQAAQIDALLTAYHDAHQFNGTALVVDAGEVVHAGGYGWANMEWAIPNTPDTKFRLGSITKQFTAALILQLVDEGHLTLETPLTDVLPDYPATGDAVTIHHLLTHTSGIPSYTGLPEFFQELSRDPATPTDFIEVFADLPLEFEPGSQWRYNNSGYFLLGVIVEQVTGQSYEEALQARLLAPAGMEDTGYDHHGTILAQRAAGYERDGLGYMNAPYLDMSLPYAAGSMYSTVGDLMKWDEALKSGTVLSAEMLALMEAPQFELPAGGGLAGAYGYGVIVRPLSEDRPVGVVEHGGGINGFNTNLLRIPEEDKVVVLLNNTGGTNLGAMTEGILAILYGEAPATPRLSIARVLGEAIEANGVEAALAQYDRLQAEDPDGYDFGERELNTLGYALLREGRVDDAIAIFERNVEAFPEASNPYDSLGEAYLVQGDTANAIVNYQRSVERNPANEGGKAVLERLGVMDAQDAVVLTEAQLDRYLGQYELAPGFLLTITRDGTQLQAQATGQPRFDVFPSSETRFYLKVVEAQLEFRLGDDGRADQLTLYQNGQVMPAPRVE